MRPLAVLALGLLAAGCGGGGDDRAAPTVERPVPRDRPAPDRDVRRALRLPDRVPLRATGPARFRQEDVVRRWMDELRRGEILRAAKRFAIPARFANFEPPTVIRSRADAIAITTSLPCGARVTDVGAARGYVVYEAVLTERPGADCGTGVGGRVSGAIRVRDGRIVEWWRLPDRPRAAPTQTI